MPDEINRREFLRTTARRGAGIAALGGITFLAHPERVFGASDRVREESDAAQGGHSRSSAGAGLQEFTTINLIRHDGSSKVFL